jgi:hypothetical protein
MIIRISAFMLVLAMVTGCDQEKPKPVVVNPPVTPEKPVAAAPAAASTNIIPVSPAAPAAIPAVPAASPAATNSSTLTEEEISEFTKSWKSPKGEEFVFTAGIGPVTFKTKAEQEAALAKHTVPFRATCGITSMIKVEGATAVPGVKRRMKVTSGSAEFYILDADGNVVLDRRTETLRKLCPS